MKSVYSQMLKRAQELRRLDEKNKNSDDYDGFWGAMSQEVYHWVAAMEKTEEINPTKK